MKNRQLFSIQCRFIKALIAVIGYLLTPAAFSQVSIDFTNSTGYGLGENSVMIENIRVDQEVANPFDPARPDIISTFYNIPWTFDLGTISLVPDLGTIVEINDDSQCAMLEIFVTNAFNGNALENAQVSVGGNYGTTDSTGFVSFNNLVAGPAHIEGSASNFNGASQQVTLNCETGTSVGLALNPESGEGAIDANEVRVVLSWGEHPRDLDSHLTGPDANSDGSTTDTTNRFHIYFASSSADVGDLDVDDTSSFGPETITIRPPDGASTLRPGLYRYSVFHFSGEQTISTSNASVTLFIGDTTRTFTPPAGAVGSSDVWTVFELVVNSSGVVTVLPVDSIDTNHQGGSGAVELRTHAYGTPETGIDFGEGLTK